MDKKKIYAIGLDTGLTCMGITGIEVTGYKYDTKTSIPIYFHKGKIKKRAKGNQHLTLMDISARLDVQKDLINEFLTKFINDNKAKEIIVGIEAPFLRMMHKGGNSFPMNVSAFEKQIILSSMLYKEFNDNYCNIHVYWVENTTAKQKSLSTKTKDKQVILNLMMKAHPELEEVFEDCEITRKDARESCAEAAMIAYAGVYYHRKYMREMEK